MTREVDIAELEALARALTGGADLTVDRERVEPVFGAEPLDPTSLAADSADREIFALLPAGHRKLLEFSNGLELAAGSYRLFGMENEEARDIGLWNHPEYWKLTWGSMADPYLCFGESVLGNQYAYLWDELRGGASPTVRELYAVTLEPLVSYASFGEFLRDGFLSVPRDAYHERIREARRRHGRFDSDQQLAYVPSPLLTGGRLDDQELLPMSARAAMIVNGDLATQLAHRDSIDGLKGLSTYRDRQGLERIRVEWEPNA